MKSVLGSSSLSLMKELTATILSSAVGVMAGYSSVAAAQPFDCAAQSVIEQNQDSIRVAGYLHELIRSSNEMEVGYRKIVKSVTGFSAAQLADILSPADLQEFGVKLQELRHVETLLKNVEAPEQFRELHMNARRSLAKGRSWLVTLYELTIQAVKTPVIVEGFANQDGLKALAEHSTSKVIEMARA